jgi:hypothetical protein
MGKKKHKERTNNFFILQKTSQSYNVFINNFEKIHK